MTQNSNQQLPSEYSDSSTLQDTVTQCDVPRHMYINVNPSQPVMSIPDTPILPLFTEKRYQQPGHSSLQVKESFNDSNTACRISTPNTACRIQNDRHPTCVESYRHGTFAVKELLSKSLSKRSQSKLSALRQASK